MPHHLPNAPLSIGTPLNAKWEGSAVAFWDVRGVDPATQKRLLGEYHSVGFTDAESGQTPVRTTSSVVGDSIETVNTFADGSIRVDTVQQPQRTLKSEPAWAGGARPSAVENCQATLFSGGENFNNCNVSAVTPAVAIGFYASYTLVQGGYDYIQNKGGSGYEQCFGGVCSVPTFQSWKQSENASGKAYLRYASTYTVGFITTTNHVRLLVGNDSASSDGA
jgi:hypothetical protein